MSRRSFGNSWGNPILTPDRLSGDGFSPKTGTMTRAGTMVKLFLLLAILVGAGRYTWQKAFDAFGDFDFSTVQSETTKVDGKDHTERFVLATDPETGQQIRAPLPKFDLSEVQRLMWIGLIGGFIVAMITIFVPRAAMVTGFIYAGLEGLALGGLSAIFEVRYPGITMMAAMSALATMLATSMIYSLGLFRLGKKGIAFVCALTLGVCLVYVADLLMGAFFGSRIDIIHSNSTGGIIVSGLVCLLAAFNFFVDFETIEESVESGAPKYMEWYAAFGVLLTLVWLYIEVLRLIAKANSRN